MQPTLNQYALAIIANNSAYRFLQQFVSIYKLRNIKSQTLYVGDAGLLPEQKLSLWGAFPGRLEFVDLPQKVFESGVKTQSLLYRKIIDNRIYFLRYLFENYPDQKIIQLDADTGIITNDLDLIDANSDMTLSVRPAAAVNHVMNREEEEYPNLGVVFWNNAARCLDFLNAWEKVAKDLPPSTKQYEQNTFYHAMQTAEFKSLNVQKIHCRYYNCYDPGWVNEKTSILHYKTVSKKIVGDPVFSRSAELNDKVFDYCGIVDDSSRLENIDLKYYLKNFYNRKRVRYFAPTIILGKQAGKIGVALVRKTYFTVRDRGSLLLSLLNFTKPT